MESEQSRFKKLFETSLSHWNANRGVLAFHRSSFGWDKVLLIFQTSELFCAPLTWYHSSVWYTSILLISPVFPAPRIDMSRTATRYLLSQPLYNLHCLPHFLVELLLKFFSSMVSKQLTVAVGKQKACEEADSSVRFGTKRMLWTFVFKISGLSRQKSNHFGYERLSKNKRPV